MKKISLALCCLLVMIPALSQTQDKIKCVSWETFNAFNFPMDEIGHLSTKDPSKTSKSDFWSMNVGPLDRDFVKLENIINYVDDMGVTKIRMIGGWAKCEQVKGQYDFAWLDSCVYGFKKIGVDVMLIFAYGNPLYGADKQLGAKLFTDDITMKAWLKWVSATTKRYQHVINEWEIWNEPNNNNGRSEDYVKLYTKTVETVKKIQPNSTIIGLSMAMMRPMFAERVIKGLKEAGQLKTMDYASFHPYSYNPDESYPEIDKLKTMIHKYDPNIKLFQNENGAPSENHAYHAIRNYPWSEIIQAKWYMRRMVGDRVRDIRSCIFNIVDMRYNEVLLSMGLLRSNLQLEVIYRKPAYYGVKRMISFLDDGVKPVGISSSLNLTSLRDNLDVNASPQVTMTYRSSATKSISMAAFEKNGTPVVLLWYNDKIPNNDFIWDQTAITIMNTHFKDPVYVEMITGKVFEIKKDEWSVSGKDTQFKKLPIWDSPMMLVERSQVYFDTTNEPTQQHYQSVI